MTRRVMPRHGAALRPAFHRCAAFSTTTPGLAPAAPSTPQPPSAPVPPGSTSGRQGQRHGDHQRSSTPAGASGVNVTPPQHRTTSYPKFDDYVAFKREVRSINERRHWQTFSKAERSAASFLSDANAAMNPKTNATNASATPSLAQQPSTSTNGQVQVTGIDAAAALSTQEWQRFDTIVAKANKAVASLADDSGYAALDCVLFGAFTVNVAAGRYATAVHLLRRMADDDRAPVPLAVITAASDLLSAIAGCSGAQSSSAAPNPSPGNEVDDGAAVAEAPTPLSIALPQVFPALSISTAALAQVQGMTSASSASAAVEMMDDTDGATKETTSVHEAVTNALPAENLRSVSIGTGAASDALLPQALGHELLLPALDACRRLGLLPSTVTSMGKYVDAKALAKILAVGEAALSAKQASTIAADDLPAPVTLHGAKGSSAVNRSHAPTISDAERGIAALETVLALSTLTADAATALTESGADLTSACASADATHPGRAALLSVVHSIKAIVSSVELPKTDDAAVDSTDRSRVLRESIMDNVMGALKTVTIALHTAGVAQNARCGEPISDGVSAIVNELAGVWRSVSGAAADVVLSCLKGNLPIIDDLEAAFESLPGIAGCPDDESSSAPSSSSRTVNDAFAFSMLLATSVSIASTSAGADLEARLQVFFTRFIEGGAFDELSAVFRSHMSQEMSQQDGAGFAAHFCLTPATVLRPEHFVIEAPDSVEPAAAASTDHHDAIVGEYEQTSAPAADASTPAAVPAAQDTSKTADATSTPSSVDTEPVQATSSAVEDDGQSFEDSAWDDEEAHGHHAADDSYGTTAPPQADVAVGAAEASVKESAPIEDAFADEDGEWGSAEEHHAVAASESTSDHVSSSHEMEDADDQSTLSDNVAAVGNATPSEPVLTNPIRVDLLESVSRSIDAVSDSVKSDGGIVSELARSSLLLASCRVEWIAQHWRTAEAAAGDALRFAAADERGRTSVVEGVQGAELESARLAAASDALDVSSLELLPAEAAVQGTDTSAADAAAAEKARLADEQARLAQVFGQAAPTAAPTSPEPCTSDNKASASSTTSSSSVATDIGEGEIVLAVDSVDPAVSLEVEAPLAAALQRALRRTIDSVGSEKTAPVRSSSEMLYFVKAVVEASADAAVFHHGLSNGRPLFASSATPSSSSSEVKKNAGASASVLKGHSQFPYAGATDMAGGVGGLFLSTSAASSAPPALEALCPTTPTMTTSSSLDPRPASVQYSAVALHKVSSAAQFAERSSSQYIVSAGGLLPSRRVQRLLADLVVRFMSPTTHINNEHDDLKNVEVLAKQEFWQSLIASLAPAMPIVERRPQTAAAASLALLAAAAVDATVDGRVVAVAFNATAALSVRTKLGLDASPSAATTDVSATSSSESTATASAFAGDFALSPEALAAIGRVARDSADVELLETVTRLHPLAYDVYGAVVESLES